MIVVFKTRAGQRVPMASPALLMLIAFVFLLLTQAASAQLTREAWRRGFQGFNMMIQGNEIEIMDKARWLQTKPSDRMLIALGDIQDLPINLAQEARAGSSLFVATDGIDFNQVLRPFGVRSENRFVHIGGDNYLTEACPKIPPLKTRSGDVHPLFDRVRYVVTNQPGTLIYDRSESKFERLALIAKFGHSFRSGAFPFALVTTRSDLFRGAFFADATFLNNQMLSKGGNAQCAKNILDWMGEQGRRKSLLLIIDNQIQEACDPTSMVVLPPPPSEEEVLDALKDLPPSAWFEFANTVVQAAEDDNLVNKFLQDFSEEITYKQAFRGLLLMIFFGVLMFGMVAYVWQRKLLRKTSSIVSEERAKVFASEQKNRLALERKVAANMILSTFCLDLTNRRLEDWSMFPQGLELGDDEESRRIVIQMSDYNQALRNLPATYWTGKRLRQLEADSLYWRSVLVHRGLMEDAIRGVTESG